MATSTVTIEELSGKKRRLVLKGGGLPLKGANFAAATVVSTTWNNGNPQATQHVLSPQELPSDWQGVWRSTQLLGTPAEYSEQNGQQQLIGLAFELLRVVDSIRQSAQLLRVTWSNEIHRKNADGSSGATHQHKEVRIGRLTELAATPANLDDIPWSATFEWVSRGATTARAVDFQGDDLIAATRAAIQQQDAVAKSVADARLRALQADGFRRKNYANQFTLGQLEQIVDAPLAIVDSFADVADAFSNRLQKVGDIILSVRETPVSIANRLFDTATSAVATVTQFVDELSQKNPEQQIAGSKLSTLTRTASYFSGVQTQAQFMQAANNRLAHQARIRRSLQAGLGLAPGQRAKASDVLVVHVPRDGDTFTTIAYRYYQADLGAELAKHNGLPGYTIKPPKRGIIIPSRSVLEARAVGTT